MASPMVPRGRRPPGRFSLPRDGRETVPPMSRFPGAASALASAANDSKLRRPVSSRPVKARAHGAADCPAAGEQGRGGRPAAPRARRAGAYARRVTARRHRRYRSPEARTSWHGRVPGPGTMTRLRGPLMDLSRACHRPAADLTPRRRAGCAGQISLSPAHPRGRESLSDGGVPVEGDRPVGRDGFPGHHAPVHRGLAEFHLSVGGYSLSRAHHEPLPRAQVGDRPSRDPYSKRDP